MKTLIAIAAAALLAFGLEGTASAATLAQIHAKAHATLTASMGQDKCLACHGGTYEAVARKTEAIKPNPHASHMGKLECTACHAVASKPRVLCHDCHKLPNLRLK